MTADNQIFTDASIDAFLSLEDDIVDLAAARALDAMANQQVLILKVIKLLDLSTDGAKVADALRKGAESLRSLHYSEQDMEIFELVVDQHSSREHLHNLLLAEL